jgi:hypothetical protein
VRSFTSWQKVALAVGGVGWAWAAVLLLATLATLKRDGGAASSADEPDRAFGNAGSVYCDVLGPLCDRVPDGGACGMAWFDEDAVLLRGIGPRNGVTVRAWEASTVGAQVFVARVTLDVWEGLGYGTGGLDSVHVFTRGANLRMVERLPPAKPGPPGWRVIRPGECVLESLEAQDASGVIGRFLIDLPANKAIRMIWQTDRAGDHVPITDSLSFGGQALRRTRTEEVDYERYVTEHDGRHELLLRRTDVSDVGHAEGHAGRRYTIFVKWGRGIYGACRPPGDFGNCFAEVR